MAHASPASSTAAPRRLFRADTPMDAFCAAVVARSLSAGTNVLAISSDKHDTSPHQRWDEALRIAAGAYRWDALLDLSGLPLAGHMEQRASRTRRLRDTLATLRILERRLDETYGAGGEGSVDELYVTLPDHGDIQVLCQLLRSAKKYYFPHTFVSPLESEILPNTPLITGQLAAQAGWRAWIADAAKGLLLGAKSRPIRQVRLDGVFSFSGAPQWNVPTFDLGPLLSPGLMGEFFSRLPVQIQHHFRELAAAAGPPCSVLLLSPPLDRSGRPHDDELAAYEYLGKQLIEVADARSLVVKPHPRSSPEWAGRVLAHLQGACAIPAIDAGAYAQLPAEILLSCFEPSACAGLASSALLAIARIYGIRALFSPSLQDTLSVHQGYPSNVMEAWLRSATPFVTLV